MTFTRPYPFVHELTDAQRSQMIADFIAMYPDLPDVNDPVYYGGGRVPNTPNSNHLGRVLARSFTIVGSGYRRADALDEPAGPPWVMVVYTILTASGKRREKQSGGWRSLHARIRDEERILQKHRELAAKLETLTEKQ